MVGGNCNVVVLGLRVSSLDLILKTSNRQRLHTKSLLGKRQSTSKYLFENRSEIHLSGEVIVFS